MYTTLHVAVQSRVFSGLDNSVDDKLNEAAIDHFLGWSSEETGSRVNNGVGVVSTARRANSLANSWCSPSSFMYAKRPARAVRF